MTLTKRFLGIDLFRGIAAYAVVVVHSGDETWGVPIDPLAIKFRLLFYFAVPFFLATSFYFMVRKPTHGLSRSFWRSRFDRIIIPYLIWSFIYLIIRLIFFVFEDKIDRINQLIQDPISIIFLGGSSYHLYFLPLLLSGTSLILLMNYFKDLQSKIFYILLCIVISIGLNILLIFSGNQFQLGPNIAFENLVKLFSINIYSFPVIRVFLVYFEWAIKCMPYFFVAIFFNLFATSKIQSSNSNKIISIFSLFIFVAVDIYGSLFLPVALKELIMAYSLLILGISISEIIKQGNQILISLGTCSFGIYLIHPIAMNVIKIFFSKINIGIMNHVTIYSILAISLSSFFLSWFIVAIALRNKWTAKYMFGV